MTTPKHPQLGLAQAILRAIAEHTGREVRGAEIYAFTNFFSVTVKLEEDGTADVTFSDPDQPDPVVTA